MYIPTPGVPPPPPPPVPTRAPLLTVVPVPARATGETSVLALVVTWAEGPGQSRPRIDLPVPWELANARRTTLRGP